jgi:GAF domain-containing protein
MPMSARDIHRALGELSSLRFGAVDLDEAMDRIVSTTHSLFDVDGAGLMLTDEEQLLRNVATSDERVHHLEDLQVEHREGPAIDAYDAKELVSCEDLLDDRRWPVFGPAAVERGLRAVLASPIPYNQQAVGVVVVVSSTRRPWPHWRASSSRAWRSNCNGRSTPGWSSSRPRASSSVVPASPRDRPMNSCEHRPARSAGG